MKLTIYTKNSMVKKEHVKIITRKLINLGSNVPEGLSTDEEHALANLLYLAAGDGTYKLTSDQINQIKSNKFSISWK